MKSDWDSSVYGKYGIMTTTKNKENIEALKSNIINTASVLLCAIRDDIPKEDIESYYDKQTSKGDGLEFFEEAKKNLKFNIVHGSETPQ